MLRGTLLALAAWLLGLSSAVGQIVTPPPGSGTGINRNGLRIDDTPRQHRHVVVPGPSYGYGYRPGGFYYGSGPGWYEYGYYRPGYAGGYYDRPWCCPNCGNRWCRGDCVSAPLIFPPVVLDAGELYGPRALRRFVAGDPVPPLVLANPAPAVQPGGPIAPAMEAQARPVLPRVSNRETRARAWRFIEQGDKHFAAGKYRDALDRYTKAAQSADELAEAYVRQGFANVGLGRFAQAEQAFVAALERNPDWPGSGFVLEELYPSDEAKRDAVRQVRGAIAKTPHAAEAHYVLAVLLHFDGQVEASRLSFRRVVELTGSDAAVAPFVPREAAAKPVAEELPQ